MAYHSTTFSFLPLELQSHILSSLSLSEVSPIISRVLSTAAIDDQYERIRRRSPRQFLTRMVYYASLGYLYGMKREIGEFIFDEGDTPAILHEVGKRGDSRMLSYLKLHGVVNIDQALIGGILARQNDFVRRYLNAPIHSVQHLLEAAAISDNLDMARELALRTTHDYLDFFYTNRTSVWLKSFNSQETLETGFEELENPEDDASFESISTAMLSDLKEPLPFTYDFIESLNLNYLAFAIDHTRALRDGYTRNYARMEWILDAVARQQHSLVLSLGQIPQRHILADVANLDDWIDILLILVGLPGAYDVLEKAREYFGEVWTVFTDPVQTSDQLRTILARSLTSIEPYEYIPIQHAALIAWLSRALNNQDNHGNLSPLNESFDNGILFLTTTHPKGKSYTFECRPGLSIIDKKVYPLTIDEYDKWIRDFFSSQYDPARVLCKLLEYHLLELWNELSPLYSPTILDHKRILHAAIVAGLNSIVEPLIPQDTSLVPTVREDYPRIIARLDQPSRLVVRPIRQENVEAARQADETLTDMNSLIEERLRLIHWSLRGK